MTAPARQIDQDSQSPAPAAERASGQSELERFVAQGLDKYAERRNYDFGPENRSNVSGLSPYVSHRLVLEEEVLASALERFPLAESEKFVQEVFWRAYFKGWLEHRPAVWFAYRQQFDARIRELDKDRSLRARYEAATSGQTGIDCFDAWALELLETGYLHNHARMWFASIWIFTLELPWELGADFFFRHLLDGDAASNTLGWRWVAGLHTRGKTYLARASNITKYTDGRFQPSEDELAPKAEALEEPSLPAPAEITASDRLPADMRYGLLVTDEDCYAETLDVPQAPSAVIGLTSVDERSPLETGDRVSEFSRNAVRDALQRLQVAYDVEGRLDDGAWGSRLTEWAKANDLSVIATSAPAQGPANDALAFAENDLRAEGIELLRLRRPYDERAWPYAQKGFFGLKKEIPTLLKALNLGQHW